MQAFSEGARIIDISLANDWVDLPPCWIISPQRQNVLLSVIQENKNKKKSKNKKQKTKNKKNKKTKQKTKQQQQQQQKQ